MLEKPDLKDGEIVACLQQEYGMLVAQIAFLPLGADQNTAVYRVATLDGERYFVKLRKGSFDRVTVALPKFLSDEGIAQVIPPLTATAGQLWSYLGAFKVVVYPYVEGRNGYQVELSDRHWIELGATIKRIHTIALPLTLKACIDRETYSPHWRDMVRRFLEELGNRSFDDRVAASLDSFLELKRAEILELVDRAERYAAALQACPHDVVLCHSDIHAGNVLIGAHDALYIVDWDNPILAPKERDLMYAGGAQGFRGHTAQEEEALFFQGYGQAEIDPVALAYYRYERIVEDIAVYCQQIFLTTQGGEDREQSFRYVQSNFLPDGTIDRARRAEKMIGQKPA
jgi:spectinomycin phosphotransferase